MKFKELFNEDWSVNWAKIDGLPSFEVLKQTPQSYKWHKEGNVLNHTHLVAEEMEKILSKYISIKKGDTIWLALMSAAICHDLGKAETTFWSEEKNDWSCKNHGVVGERITRNLFSDEDFLLRERVCYMVRQHMVLHHILDDEEKFPTKLKKLSHGLVCVEYMLWLNEADSRGSINETENDEFLTKELCKIECKAFEYGCLSKPYTMVEKGALIREFFSIGEPLNKTRDFVVYIMCGFPGCGKSTYVKKSLSDKTVISRDIIRQELGINGATIKNDKKTVGTKEQENKVSEIFNAKVIECCEQKKSFVIDNTNLKFQYRKKYLDMVMKYNPLIKIIYVEAPDFLNDCMKRREGEIEKKVYDRMKESFDFPQLYECDELVLVKQDDESVKEYLFNDGFNLRDNISSYILCFIKQLRKEMLMEGIEHDDKAIEIIDNLITNTNNGKYDEF